MKRISLVLMGLTFMFQVHGQEAQQYFDKGLQKSQAGNFEEALDCFTKSIELNPLLFDTWYNRGLTKLMMERYEEAVPDFEQTIKLSPKYSRVYLYRGILKKSTTDYEGALADFSYVIQLENAYGEAYYNRALVYEMLSMKDSACLDFERAKKFGMQYMDEKIAQCNDTIRKKVYPILRLSQMAEDTLYGFTPEKPIKVGNGPDGGASNEKVYFKLLRDAQGNPVKFKKLNSCCSYKSENSPTGLALLDRFEIKYINAEGKEMKSFVFLSYYDYEEPKVLYGFKTFGMK